MFEIEDGNVKISVRELVEFIYRSGDIDSGKGLAADSLAMQAGTRIHKKIQKSMGASYKAEVLCSTLFNRKNYSLLLEGRADGIITYDEEVIIDEIKGMYADVELMKEPVYVHLAQAMCYAYITAHEKNLDKISVQLTYVNLETEIINRFKKEYTVKSIDEWMENTLISLDKWIDCMIEYGKLRNGTIKPLQFPFEYRDGQRELVVSAYRTITRKKTVFVQAPTGVGKTMSTLFPAVKAMGEGICDKIFYLTAKTITRTVASEALNIMADRGVHIKRLIITAKEKICMRQSEEGEKKTACNPKECPYAKGHFDRVNAAVYDMITACEDISREVIEEYAGKYNVCPFEMSLDAAYWVDVIICDYNYVFDPDAYLKRFFAEGTAGKYVFLIDEAHNLVERGRTMYSAAIIKEDILAFKRMIGGYDKKLMSLAEKCNKDMLELKRSCNDKYTVMDNAGVIIVHLNQLMEYMIKFAQVYRNFPMKDEFNDFFFKVREFLNISDIVDEHYVVYSRMNEDGTFMVKQYCVDPSLNLKGCMDKGISTILFSATLLPISYYKALLRGDEKEDYAVYAHSSFDTKNRCVLIADDITTRYTQRGRLQYERVAGYIEGMVSCRRGNYMVFFPSYGYMQEVCRYIGENPEYDIIVQESSMSEQQKEEFLDKFKSSSKEKSLIGMCVMGGIFSEGIDLKEDSLIGAVIVGTGLPQVCNEQEILKNYFDDNGQNGFMYSYLYPGFNKVLQSAGRVIRTAQDRGVILLLDERFLSRQYDGMFPQEWTEVNIVNKNTFCDEIRKFWEKAT